MKRDMSEKYVCREAMKNDKVQNIYDLEGNCSEWCTIQREPYINRGGYFNIKYGAAAGARNSNPDNQYDRKTFRLVLYIV